MAGQEKAVAVAAAVMMEAKLKPFVRPNLDVLFVALNPPKQSNSNGHYFSGENSRFFDWLFESGLLIKHIDKSTADETVFGSSQINYKNCTFGIIDLVPEIVESNSSKVRPTRAHVESLVVQIRQLRPRFVCIIHSTVAASLQRHGKLSRKYLARGICGKLLDKCDSEFVYGSFPTNTNSPFERNERIFEQLRTLL